MMDSSATGSPYDFSPWLGRSEETDDVVTAAPLAGLAATLDHRDPPWRHGVLPPLAHWLYFLPRTVQQDIAEDGHERRGGFLPPVPLPRRMWAGGAFTFAAPLSIGETIRRRSTIADIQHKSGRSGDLVFVKVVHEVFGATGLAVREEQDIVYREAPTDAASDAQRGASGDVQPLAESRSSHREPAAELPSADWTRTIQPDAVLLFRFSALTFNGHRIHYDRDYCREREGYPGLVVHGPLTATLLMDLFLRNNHGAQVRAFRFRGQRPLFDTGPLTVCGAAREAGASLWALDEHGDVAMTAELETA
jgi:3-methylfumaryl-CoA hydratase